MRTRTLLTAALGGLAVYAFAVPHGRRVRRRLLDSRLDSVAWIRSHRPSLEHTIAELEGRIDRLGADLAAQVAHLAPERQVKPALEADDWSLSEHDFDDALRGLKQR
jgi:hypothetical protein